MKSLVAQPQDDLAAFRETLVERRRRHVRRYAKLGLPGLPIAAMTRLTEIQAAIDAVDRAQANEQADAPLGQINADDD
ncbi:hypothetical protein [Methylopila sp. 73B]|uniref:hypothetical protein n=1 Tax=Methylopila sp. 73B TaxID=1120792 RepID=UPI000368B1D6|nr:hypothetical protein [Methylopila sp. 73B]